MICPPLRLDKKPDVERCTLTFKQEWLDRFSLHTLVDCNEALQAFPHYHNHQRIHLCRICQGRTSDEAFPILPRLLQILERIHLNDWLQVQHGRVFRRRVRSNGSIQIDKHLYYVDEKLAGQAILLHLDV